MNLIIAWLGAEFPGVSGWLISLSTVISWDQLVPLVLQALKNYDPNGSNSFVTLLENLIQQEFPNTTLPPTPPVV